MLELLTDIDMLLMVEKGIQGRITRAVKCYAKTNNKYMNGLHNPNEESRYLQYFDANNLYGWPIIEKLPTHSLLQKEAEDFNPPKIDEFVKRDRWRFLLEVDLEYPKDLHKNHHERMKIGKVEKVVPNIKDRKGYVVHIRALNQA